jgi:hypothetical protein
MKKLTMILGLLVLLGSTGIATADEYHRSAPGPRISGSITFPGVRFVYGRPNVYCWYQGRYYNHRDWDRFERSHRDRDNRFNRDNDHRFDREHDRD